MPELSYSIFGTLSRDETFIKVSGDSNYPTPFATLANISLPMSASSDLIIRVLADHSREYSDFSGYPG